MTPFEILKKRIAHAVVSEGIEEKTRLLEESKYPQFFEPRNGTGCFLSTDQ